MQFAVLFALVAAVFAAPQGYNLEEPSGEELLIEAGGSSVVDFDSSEFLISACKDGEVLHVDGTCVLPEISRRVYVFDIPEQERPVAPAPSLPPPTVDHNIIFVRLPEEGPAPEPIVIPPPRQNNIVYVLNKQEEQVQRVIEVPAHPQSDPEIYFVNYQEGDNPSLPIGVDLETALGVAAATGGQIIVDGSEEFASGEDHFVAGPEVGLGIGEGAGAGSQLSGLYSAP